MSKKNTRQEVIKMILTSQAVSNQEELLQELFRAGFPTTQATLSRDLKQMRVVKAQTDDGRYTYLLPGEQRFHRVSDTHITASRINQLGMLNIRFSGNIAVIHTPPGHAAHVAYDIDRAEIHEVMGTIAGDDTIFIALSENASRPDVLDKISAIIPYGQLKVE
ncbi:MAG: arginine repressor [Bacteroidaceae bacterium]|nr:arginine repressor [Bacteroidaceae bacterium]